MILDAVVGIIVGIGCWLGLVAYSSLRLMRSREKARQEFESMVEKRETNIVFKKRDPRRHTK